MTITDNHIKSFHIVQDIFIIEVQGRQHRNSSYTKIDQSEHGNHVIGRFTEELIIFTCPYQHYDGRKDSYQPSDTESETTWLTNLTIPLSPESGECILKLSNFNIYCVTLTL